MADQDEDIDDNDITIRPLVSTIGPQGHSFEVDSFRSDQIFTHIFQSEFREITEKHADSRETPARTQSLSGGECYKRCHS